MPKPCASATSEAGVVPPVDRLFNGFGDEGKTIADVARNARLEHDTVRLLCRDAGGGCRTIHGFFVVPALAWTRGLSMELLAAETLDYSFEPRQP